MTIQLSGIVRDRSFANTEIELIGDVQIGGNVLFGEKTVINGNGCKIESFGELKFEGGEGGKTRILSIMRQLATPTVHLK